MIVEIYQCVTSRSCYGSSEFGHCDQVNVSDNGQEYSEMGKPHAFDSMFSFIGKFMPM